MSDTKRDDSVIARTSEFIDSIAVDSTSNAFAITSSALEGNVWDGTVFAYNSKGEMEGMAAFTHSASCLTWVHPGVLAVGLDNGDAAVLTQGKDGFSTKVRMREHGKPVNDISWNKKANRIATASFDSTVKLWNPDQARSFDTIEAHSDACLSVSFSSASADLMVTGGKDNTANVWSLRSLSAVQHRVRCSHAVSAVACASDGNLFAIGLDSGDVHVLDLRSIKKPLLSNLKAHSGTVNDLAFSGNNLAAVGSDGCVNVWKCDSGDRKTVGRHNEYAQGVAWDADAQAMYSCGWDKTVRRWGKELWQ